MALRKYAKPLGLENKKLKSFERYIGIAREDEFDGGALIEIYVEYIHNKLMRIFPPLSYNNNPYNR